MPTQLSAGNARIGTVGLAAGAAAIGTLGAGTNTIGKVRAVDETWDVTLTLDTGAYASGDVLADTQLVGACFQENGGKALLMNITVFDLDDNAGDLVLVFLNANTSLGSENSAASIADADLTDIVAVVDVAATNYVDFTNSQIADIGNIGKVIEAAGAADDLYVAVLSEDTKTYTASGIKLRVGLSF